MLEALCSCSSYNWCNCAPLTWHQFSKMKQFFFLLATPFSFLDWRIQPFEPNNYKICLLYGYTVISMTWHSIEIIFSIWSQITNHLALHCLADFRWSNEAIRDHWFLPYFITADFKISSYLNKINSFTRCNYIKKLINIPRCFSIHRPLS